MVRAKSIVVIVGVFILGALVFVSILGFDKFDFFDRKTRLDLEYVGGSILFISPQLTEAAYSKNGFYWYYDNRCGTECLTVDVNAKGEPSRYGAYNLYGVQIFKSLNYPIESDYQIHLKLVDNPDYLAQFEKIVLFHNEYVTQELFDALTSHPNVIFLYPNALYGKVEINNGMMTLIKGHGYQGYDNGFGYQYDNTRPYEFDNKCESWAFNKIPNGYQLNCYPENVLTTKPEIIKAMLELRVETL